MNTCPNCDSTAQVKSQWHYGITMVCQEYTCGCGHHWVDRYEFFRRDTIKQGESSEKNN